MGQDNFKDYNAFVQVASWCAQALLIGLIPAVVRIATHLVDEQRQGFREHLRVMGCGELAFLSSMYISSLLRTLPVVLLVTILARLIWWHGLAAFQIYLVVQIYFFAMVSLDSLMPALFNSATWTMVLMLLLTLTSTIFAPVVSALSAGFQVIVCFLSPTVACWYGLTYALAAPATVFTISCGGALSILICQTFLFAILAYYLRRLFPGPFGVPAHPLFFLQREKKPTARSFDPMETELLTSADANDIVVMKRLRKYFGEQRETAAVDLTLSIHRGEILALLGHNGAGKTTTISMLCGLIAPTDYEVATVGGLDISRNMGTIRHNIGVCPQHDVLFPYLSARQHLQLFANLRGVEITNNRLDELLMFLELPLDATKVQDYSGGMKRRVSVCSALVGEPAVVFLDEPTTALDEVSRQKLWQLLKMERSKGTTMILTTHMMEEAETLGDRIAIMSAGSLHSEGTAMELKARCGTGYYLEFAKGKNFSEEAACRAIQSLCPEASLHLDSGAEVTYFLPMSYHSQYADILANVEARLGEIGAESFGLNMSTLEDVFVSIAESTSTTGTTTRETEEQISRMAKELKQRSSTDVFRESGEHLSDRKR